MKLSVAEADSDQFQHFAGQATRIFTAAIARFEPRTVFRRREAEAALPVGEAAALSAELDLDIAEGRFVVQAIDASVESEFARVLEACFSQTPPIFIRTNDALHIASALAGGETEFITADSRQREAAELMGLKVHPG